jgi:hypothetical protein
MDSDVAVPHRLVALDGRPGPAASLLEAVNGQMRPSLPETCQLVKKSRLKSFPFLSRSVLPASFPMGMIWSCGGAERIFD